MHRRPEEPPEGLPGVGLEALLDEAKRRGQRLRSRRRRAVAGAGAIAVVAIAAGIFSILPGNGRRQVHVVGPPSQPSGAISSPGAHSNVPSPEEPGPSHPGALAVAENGDLVVADAAKNQILQRAPDGTFLPLAGTGRPGFSGDGGPAQQAALNGPGGMAVGADGTLYVADVQNNRVRAISPAGIITTVAGGGAAGSCPLIPTGTRAVGAPLGGPSDVALGPGGRLYIAAPCNNEVVRLEADGTLTDVAGRSDKAGVVGLGGPAGQASPDGPHALGFDRAGDLYVFGSNTKTLLMITPAGVMTAPIGAETGFYPKGSGGFAQRPDGSVVAFTQQRLVTLSPTGMQTLVDFAVLGPAAVGGVANFLPAGLAVGPDGTIYTDTNPDFGFAQQSAIVAIAPGGQPKVLEQAAAAAVPSPASSRTPASLVLGPDGLGLVGVNEIQAATVNAVTQVFGPPTGTEPGACSGTTEVEWHDLSVEFQGGTFHGYRYNPGGFAGLGAAAPPTGTAVPRLQTEAGVTLGMQLGEAQALYPPSAFTMAHGGTISVRGTYGTLAIEFASSAPTATVIEIKGGQPCGDV
ncbi:MAG TPA: hypothetical protein VFW71_02960 [Actinomycetota bacterium]|nr:hypothetical protein [Actinomycetota bacterium]